MFSLILSPSSGRATKKAFYSKALVLDSVFTFGVCCFRSAAFEISYSGHTGAVIARAPSC